MSLLSPAMAMTDVVSPKDMDAVLSSGGGDMFCSLSQMGRVLGCQSRSLSPIFLLSHEETEARRGMGLSRAIARLPESQLLLPAWIPQLFL